MRRKAAAGIARLEGLAVHRSLVERLADSYYAAAGEHSAPLDAFVDALLGVGDTHPLPVVAELTELLKSPRASVRAFATFLYGGSQAPPPAPLLPLLRDSDSVVRASAISAISAFAGDSAVVPALLPLLTDTDEGVRVMAAYVLADIRDPQALPALQRTAKEDSAKTVRQAATHAVRRIKGTDRWLWWGLILLVAVVVVMLIWAGINS
jgi:HEAT repeat protein